MVRESNVRMIALASTIALALTLPLAAAIAGPSGPGDPAPAAKPSVSPQPRGNAAERAAATGKGDRPPGTPRGSAQDAPLPGHPGSPGSVGVRDGGRAGGGGRPGAPGGGRPGDLLAGLGLGEGVDHGGGRTAFCGPVVSSPNGIKAQTCVLSEGGDDKDHTKSAAKGHTKSVANGYTKSTDTGHTKGAGGEGTGGDGVDGDGVAGKGVTGEGVGGRAEERTKAVLYYRNTSGAPLRAVLTLMRPDGRTVQTHCTLPATGEPGSCGTPSGPTVRGGVPYSAVAEIADVRDDRLLLRAGSNSAPPGAVSDR
ncbi:hypothetical protein [Streptomyces olivaceiscleroticus]